MTTLPQRLRARPGWPVLLGALLLATLVYAPGLSGGWLFDDYPNIVDNHGVQPTSASVANLVRAALSSPSSEFKRPLASLTFAANYLVGGLNPYGWKLVNLGIHLLNGLLVFLLARRLLGHPGGAGARHRAGWPAAMISAGWLLLPINLTGVLYVVQRMESLANVFVLVGLLGYVTGRQRMLAGQRGLMLCVASLVIPTALGLLAKETAVILPLYAALTEWIVFRAQKPLFSRADDSDEGMGEAQRCPSAKPTANAAPGPYRTAEGTHKDGRILGLFVGVLVLPLAAGLAWLLPGILSPNAWATRDFTMGTRLLSEARIVVDYIAWTLLPTPSALSFYHDDFHVSTSVLSPWTTLTSIALLAVLMAGVFALRRRRPLVALGLALYLGCHLLTGTILPLELIYEHRNYFASLGLLLALIPLLTAPRELADDDANVAARARPLAFQRPLPLSLPRQVLLIGLLLLWTTETALTAYAWGDPLRLAQDLAARAPASPRAQYELGRTYIIYSHYDPDSVFTRAAYAPLERAMKLPDSSILPEQALIFMNARMQLPIKDAWWNSLIGKLKAHKPGVQDESSLGALTQCTREGLCQLPTQPMLDAFLAALSHPKPSARLLAMYADYAWNVLKDRPLALQVAREASSAAPSEPAYLVTLTRMLIAQARYADAAKEIARLEKLNIAGRMDADLADLRRSMSSRKTESSVH